VKAGDGMAWLGGVWQKVNPTTARVIGERFPTQDTHGKSECAATINQYGKGQIGAIYGPMGSVFYRSHYPVIRQMLAGIMQKLFPYPIVELNAPPCVDVSIRRQDDKLLIHLANTAGMQVPASYAVIDFIPSLGQMELIVRLERKPKKVYVVPEDFDVKTHWSDGKFSVLLPKLDIHSVVVIE
jgi:hypothetical protein